jgi:hypothetical protein
MSPPKKQDMPFGLPLTISAGKVLEHEDRAANKQRRGGVVNFAALTKVEPSAQQGDPQGRPPTKRELEDQVRRDSYRVGDPTPTTVDLRKADLPGFMRLEASQIKTYDHNPRIFKNEKREDIKASLLAHGLLTLTPN